MESEKVKEIKKALENCQKNNCLDCPYFIDEKRCRANDLLLDAITLINELEKGNEALSFAVKQGFNDCQTKTLKQFAERLKDSGAVKALLEMETMPKLFKNIHDEIVKEIDETLKEFIK